jgi:hypothetical protein
LRHYLPFVLLLGRDHASQVDPSAIVELTEWLPFNSTTHRPRLRRAQVLAKAESLANLLLVALQAEAVPGVNRVKALCLLAAFVSEHLAQDGDKETIDADDTEDDDGEDEEEAEAVEAEADGDEANVDGDADDDAAGEGDGLDEAAKEDEYEEEEGEEVVEEEEEGEEDEDEDEGDGEWYNEESDGDDYYLARMTEADFAEFVAATLEPGLRAKVAAAVTALLTSYGQLRDAETKETVAASGRPTPLVRRAEEMPCGGCCAPSLPQRCSTTATTPWPQSGPKGLTEPAFLFFTISFFL